MGPGVTDLHLIRHGEAVSNVEPVIAGIRSDQGLTERGRRQAALLEQRLRADPPRADVLYVSSLPRARDTGKYVARALGLPARLTHDLHELRPGEADGLSIAQWRARADRDVPPQDPFLAFSPHGESWADFLHRAVVALSGLVDRHEGQSVVAVCHGGVIEASFCLAFGLGPSAPRPQIAPLNTGITHWRHQLTDRGGSTWTLMSFNDARHLDDIRPPADRS